MSVISLYAHSSPLPLGVDEMHLVSKSFDPFLFNTMKVMVAALKLWQTSKNEYHLLLDWSPPYQTRLCSKTIEQSQKLTTFASLVLEKYILNNIVDNDYQLNIKYLSGGVKVFNKDSSRINISKVNGMVLFGLRYECVALYWEGDEPYFVYVDTT